MISKCLLTFSGLPGDFRGPRQRRNTRPPASVAIEGLGMSLQNCYRSYFRRLPLPEVL